MSTPTGPDWDEITDCLLNAIPARDEILTAIRNGVIDAFLHAMSASAGNEVPYFRDDMLQAIREGIENARLQQEEQS